MRKLAEEMLEDIEKDTVDFRPNFDDTLTEPTVLPSKIPNLLVNGASGIAVGMATNMAPHNLTEIIDGIIAYIDNRDITIEELMEFIKGPDFPTGGIIYGYAGVQEAFETGRGRIVMRAKAEIESYKNDRERIIVTEIPYQVNKANMIERTAELVNEKKIEGISEIRDESDREGMRIVYEIKRDANASIGSSRSFSGKASFYGNESGSRTASGQRFNQEAMTAAHRTLPFGTRVKVTHAGRSVVVTINDRGPFIRGRVLDLSKGAARAVGLTGRGVGHVVAEVQ